MFGRCFGVFWGVLGMGVVMSTLRFRFRRCRVFSENDNMVDTQYPAGTRRDVHDLLGEANMPISVRSEALLDSKIGDSVYMNCLDTNLHPALKGCPEPTVEDFWLLFSALEDAFFDVYNTDSIQLDDDFVTRLQMAKKRYLVENTQCQEEIVVVLPFDATDAAAESAE